MQRYALMICTLCVMIYKPQGLDDIHAERDDIQCYTLMIYTLRVMIYKPLA